MDVMEHPVLSPGLLSIFSLSLFLSLSLSLCLYLYLSCLSSLSFLPSFPLSLDSLSFRSYIPLSPEAAYSL
jgi:hypothetical protein